VIKFMFGFRFVAVLTMACALAVTHSAYSEEVVSVAAEPQHKIRYDDGALRISEVQLARGVGTLMHQHMVASDLSPII